MDQTQDISGKQLYKYIQLYEPPEFVKKADSSDLCGDNDLPQDCYANAFRREFPCHTAAATWLSTAFFLDNPTTEKRANIGAIQQRLDYYTNYHGITNSIKALKEKIASYKNKPEPSYEDSDFALVYLNGDQKVRKYPLRNRTEIKEAAHYLERYRDDIPYKIRKEFADKVLTKAASLNFSIKEDNGYLERQAGYGGCSIKTAVACLKDRVSASRKGPGELSFAQKEMLKLADIIEKNPLEMKKSGMFVKLAEIVDDFDRSTGIYRNYGDQIKRIEDVLFELTNEKLASAIKTHCATITGNIYEIADLEKLALNDIRKFLGDDIAQAVGNGKKVDSEKIAEIVPTLDRHTATILDNLMCAVGYSPIAKEAGAPIGATHDYFMELASHYTK